ncbi:MAG: hypothetical protein ACJ741_11305 [Pyrinomonadaceae bacterium]
MRILGIIFIALLLAPITREQSPSTKPALEWENVRAEYTSFDEIKPTLVNHESYSIYLSRIWPHGSAQLERFDESSGKWELGGWSGGCGTVAKPAIPIEIKSGESSPIHVYWQLSTDDWDHPQFFVMEDHETKRPLKGKYKFVLRYSLTPWTLIHHPKQIYRIESQEFQVG